MCGKNDKVVHKSWIISQGTSFSCVCKTSKKIFFYPLIRTCGAWEMLVFWKKYVPTKCMILMRCSKDCKFGNK